MRFERTNAGNGLLSIKSVVFIDRWGMVFWDRITTVGFPDPRKARRFDPVEKNEYANRRTHRYGGNAFFICGDMQKRTVKMPTP